MKALFQLRTHIHHKILDRYDLARLQTLPHDRQRDELKSWIELCLQEDPPALNSAEHHQLIQDIQHEMLGLGPLETLLNDSSISDILVNGPDHIYVERAGLLTRCHSRFEDQGHLIKTIEKIVSRVGRRIDESSPMVDARLPDGSRVNAIIPPLALDGPILSIRRFAKTALTLHDLIAGDSLTRDMADQLTGYVQARLNILISGGTGSGKTTLLNVLSDFVSPDERLITIEDAAELRLHQAHVVRLETRPANLEGQGEVTQRMLVRNALRMRPDRLILGEVRGAEALDMLHAMNTGHEGSLTTVHANSPDDALIRLEQLVMLGHGTLSPITIRAQIRSAIQVVVQMARMSDGSRKVVSISELTGGHANRLTTRALFTYSVRRRLVDGHAEGRFHCSGHPSSFQARLQRFNAPLPNTRFSSKPEYPQ